MTNDYTLLRPFDLEAVKAGAPIIFLSEASRPVLRWRTYVYGPDCLGKLVVLDGSGEAMIGLQAHYRMAPLGWVEGKPVYPGDVLYHCSGRKVEIRSANREGDCFSCGSGVGPWEWLGVSVLSWAKPVRKVKKEGWINIYPTTPNRRVGGFAQRTEDDANSIADPGRIACIKIEWEETLED